MGTFNPQVHHSDILETYGIQTLQRRGTRNDSDDVVGEEVEAGDCKSSRSIAYVGGAGNEEEFSSVAQTIQSAIGGDPRA